MKKEQVRRRDFFKYLGLGSAAIAFPGISLGASGNGRIKQNSPEEEIFDKVFQTPFADTHEHLADESVRLSGKSLIGGKSNDWTMIFSQYIDSDMIAAGMKRDEYDLFFSPDIDPFQKWKILEPYWPYIKHTGYAMAVRISMNELYDVVELSDSSIKKLQTGYENLVHKGFYSEILKTKANIESCQVNAYPVLKSEMPEFLLTDLWVDQLIMNPGNNEYSQSAGINVSLLGDWHSVIDWWFKKYGQYVVAIKVSIAYSRNIDFIRTEADDVQKIFRDLLKGRKIDPDEKKKLEDHLFWYVIGKATEYHLPVKMHTGYHAQWKGKNSSMDLTRVRNNPSDASYLCQQSEETNFVFFHIAYPYYEEMLALAKQYSNAYIDMCWTWIINPVSAKEFLKKYLVTVPTNKIFTFGGDYVPVEPILGHSIIARSGIASALSELTDEGFLKLKEALKLSDTLLNGNARKVFRLEEKQNLLKGLDWEKI